MSTSYNSTYTTNPISVIILSYNDEHSLQDALESVYGWVGEIHVVDSGSTDNTLAIARNYTENVTIHPFDNYAAQRNWAQDNLTLLYDWVLHLDADERVTPELQSAIAETFSGPNLNTFDGFLISRRAIFLGRWISHGGLYPVYHLRLFKKGTGRCEDRLYDQHFVTSGNVMKLSGDIIDNVTTDLETWTLRHVRLANL